MYLKICRLQVVVYKWFAVHSVINKYLNRVHKNIIILVTKQISGESERGNFMNDIFCNSGLCYERIDGQVNVKTSMKCQITWSWVHLQ